jgi:hypothetical protein
VTIREQLAAVDEAEEFWTLSLPGIEPPSKGTLASWLGLYQQSLIAYGLAKAATKARRMRETGMPMSTSDCTKYATSVH